MTEEMATIPITELEELEIDTVGLVGKAANRRKFLLFKSDQEEPMSEETPNIEQIEESVGTVEDVKGLAKVFADFVNLFKAQQEAEIEVEEPTEDDDPPEDEVIEETETVVESEIVKADPRIDEFEKAQKAMQEKLEKAQERIEAAEAIAKEERDLRLTAEWIEKADALAIPGEVSELAALLKWADEADSDKGEQLMTMLNAASEAVMASGVFVEKGTTQGTESDSPFLEQVEARVTVIRTADPTLSQEVAYAKAYNELGREQPDLARQHIAKRQTETGRK